MKNIFRKSGAGVLFSIALLVGMMCPPHAQAGNIAHQTGAYCKNCSSPYEKEYTIDGEPAHVGYRRTARTKSVEDVYGVHDIDGMTTLYDINGEWWLGDYSDMNNWYCPYKIKDVLEEKGLISSVEKVDPTTGSASIPVTVTREAPLYNVVVPTSIPIAVKADGTVIPPSNVKIINYGQLVQPKTVEMQQTGVWSFADYNNGDGSSLKINSNMFGLALTANDFTIASHRSDNTSSSWTTNEFDVSSWSEIAKNGGELPISVDAIVSPVSQDITAALTVANIVITFEPGT